MKIIENLHFRTRLVIVLLLASIPTFIYIYFDALKERKNFEARIQTEISYLSRHAASAQLQWLDETSNFFTLLSHIPSLQNKDSAKCSSIFAEIIEHHHHPLYLNLFAVKADGSAFCSSVPDKTPANYSEFSWFKRAILNKNITVGDFQPAGNMSEIPILVTSLPVYDKEGNLKFLINASLNIEWLNNIISNVTLPSAYVIDVLDQNLSIIARYPDTGKWLGQSLLNKDIMLNTILADHKGAIEGADFDGVMSIYYISPVRSRQSDTGIYISISMPADFISNEIYSKIYRDTIGFVILMLLMLIIFWYSSNFIFLNRFKLLSTAAERFGNGDLTARSGIAENNSEEGRFARVFDAMAESVQKRDLERLQKEDALIKSEEKYRKLVDTMNEGFGMQDKNNILTFLNKRALEVLGYQLNELVGKPTTILFDEKNQKIFQVQMVKRRKGDSKSYEMSWKTKDGINIPTIISPSPLFDKDGNFDGSFAIFTDLRDFKKKEAELIFFKTILDQSNDVVYIVEGKTGKILDINKTVYESIGFSREECLKMNVLDIEIGFNRDTYGFAYKEIHKTGKLTTEGLHKRKDASTFPVEVSLNLVIIDGIEYLLGINRDLTERRKAESLLKDSETRFRTLAEECPVGIYETNLNGKCIYVNHRWSIMSGLKLEEALGDGWIKGIHPDDRQMVSDNWHNMIKSEGDWRLEYRFKKLNGKTVWVSGSATEVKDAEGNSTGYIGTNTDITERKQTEQLLEFLAKRNVNFNHEKFLISLVEYIGTTLGIDYVFIVTLKDGSKGQTVAAFAKGKVIPNMTYDLRGTPCENVAGKQLCYYSSDIQKLFPEDTMLGQMGAESYIGIPLWDSKNQAIGLIALIHSNTLPEPQTASEFLNITSVRVASELEVMLAQDIISRTENLFSSLINFAPSVIYIKDDKGRYITVNNKFEKMVKMNNAQVCGKTDFDFFPNEIAQKMKNNDIKVLEYGMPMEYEEEAVHEDCLHTYLSIKFPLFDAYGKVNAICGISNDITDRKKSEEHLKLFRNLIDESNDSIEVIEPDTGKFIEVNATHRSMHGYSIEDYKSMRILDIDPSVRDSSDYANAIKMVREKGKSVLNSIHTRKDGSQFPVEVGISIVKYEKEYLIAIVRDITDRRIAENELAKHREHLEEIVKERTTELVKARNRAEESDRLKSIFLATMSHELRTPLNSIIGFTGIILEGFSGPINDEQKKQLDMVNVSANHLLMLINDILDVSKMEAGQLKIQKTIFNLCSVIENSALLMKNFAIKKGLELSVDRCEHAIDIFSDQRRVEQILYNLISNAIKFTDAGSVKLQYEVEGNQLVIKVIDTGIGINTEDMKDIFKPFRQFEDNLHHHEGTGLGLNISKRLAEMLGGSISVISKWQAGSTFKLTLPIGRYAK